LKQLFLKIQKNVVGNGCSVIHDRKLNISCSFINQILSQFIHIGHLLGRGALQYVPSPLILTVTHSPYLHFLKSLLLLSLNSPKYSKFFIIFSNSTLCTVISHSRLCTWGVFLTQNISVAVCYSVLRLILLLLRKTWYLLSY
jgi:hypothetical protein